MHTHKAEIKKVNDVIYSIYESGEHITEEDSAIIDAAQLTLSAGQDMFVLVDVSSNNVTFEDEAKDFFLHKGKMMPFTKAVAIVGELRSRSLIHTIFRRSKTWYDVKKFTTTEEAMDWFSHLRKSAPALN